MAAIRTLRVNIAPSGTVENRSRRMVRRMAGRLQRGVANRCLDAML